MAQTVPFVDRAISKTISRKLIVFLMGSTFFAMGLGLSSGDWMNLAMMYIGTQGLIDAVKAYTTSKES